MSQRRNKLTQAASGGGVASDSEERATTGSRHSRRKLWCFRLLAVTLVPLSLAGVVELVLRLAGVGYPTAFFLSTYRNGEERLVPNNQFAWRFFGREMARWPFPCSIARHKSPNTIRIFVLGESAARGEPQPEFGLPRMLEAILSLRHPGVQFEVVNAAMTAINSHTILPIARDCAEAQGDIWVVYMGNNEVVGPFGAGTVFGAQAPPMALIRASLALKRMKLGQTLDAALSWYHRDSRDDTVWGGMTLFLDQQVAVDDPRLEGVYHHFAENLSEILQLGRRRGVGIVLSTVAVNLESCPPFSSQHRANLTKSELAAWETAYQAGVAAQKAGNYPKAVEHFKSAIQIDDQYAELRYRLGQCNLAEKKNTTAAEEFSAARDSDTLRFRCDAKLNELIRDVAAKHATSRTLFADAERVFAQASPSKVPGQKFFFEHVHFTFEGNYLLARTLAEQVEKLLPERAAGMLGTPTRWPTAEDCARRLGRSDWHQVAALNSIIATLNDPPFTAQLNHANQMRELESALAQLSPALQPAGLQQAIRITAAAAAGQPDDPILQRQLATLKRAIGDLTGAATAARREVVLLENDFEGWALLGSILAQQRQSDEAAAAFHRAFQLGPQGVKSRLDLAGALAMLGRQEEAIREYQKILRQKPRSVPALLQLGQVLEKLGRRAEAESCFDRALTNRSQRLPELLEMAHFFESRGQFGAALTVLSDAVRLNPTDASLQLSTGRCLASLGRYEEAASFASAAIRFAPELVEAHLLHGITLWRQGHAEQAIAEFDAALRLQPGSLDARVNLGIVFAQAGRREEALVRFREVLQLNPNHAVARKYFESLTGKGDEAQPK